MICYAKKHVFDLETFIFWPSIASIPRQIMTQCKSLQDERDAEQLDDDLQVGLVKLRKR